MNADLDPPPFHTSVLSRRTALRAAATLVIGAIVDHKLQLLTPAQAAAAGAGFRSLGEKEAALVSNIAETLVPGATGAGLVYFLDHHLTVPYRESLLMARYLDIKPPYLDFYRNGLKAFDAHVHGSSGSDFATLDEKQRLALVRRLGDGQPADWQGPSASLFLFALRADAVDVVYGTPDGYEKLGVPYMPHIFPEEPW